MENFQLATQMSCYSKSKIHESDFISYYVSEDTLYYYGVKHQLCTPNERIFMLGKRAREYQEGVRDNEQQRDKTEEKRVKAEIKGIKMVKRENGDKVVTNVECKALMLTNAFTQCKISPMKERFIFSCFFFARFSESYLQKNERTVQICVYVCEWSVHGHRLGQRLGT